MPLLPATGRSWHHPSKRHQKKHKGSSDDSSFQPGADGERCTGKNTLRLSADAEAAESSAGTYKSVLEQGRQGKGAEQIHAAADL